MVNTKILTQEFDYHRPGSLKEAFDLLAEYGGTAKVIAGGTDVVPQLKYEKIAPQHLIALMKISGLSDINEDNGGVKIGACARLSDVKQACAPGPQHAALHDALRSIGKTSSGCRFGTAAAGFKRPCYPGKPGGKPRPGRRGFYLRPLRYGDGCR